MDSIRNETWPGFEREVLAILRCPECQSGLRQEDDGLVCVSCSGRYRVLKSVPSFVDQQWYRGSFGCQWLMHNKTQLNDENSRRSEKDFIRRKDLTVGDLPVAVRGRKPAASHELDSPAPAAEAELCAG